MAITTSIWKDTEYLVNSSASPFAYHIDLKTGSTSSDVVTVFNGKAWIRPADEYLHININKIAQDYLESNLPDLRTVTGTTSYNDSLAFRTFYLKNSGGTTLETFNFLNDWSYENTPLTGTTVLTNPINGHGCNGMIYLRTTFSSSSPNVVTSCSLAPGSSYSNTSCGQYAIYYLQRNGGWASFLIEGNVIKKDSYKRYQISSPFNNTTLEFEKKTYHNEINTAYELRTGWLSDSEAANLAENLIGTNKAYLHNLVTGEIMPVLSTDGSAVYKTWRNQGRKLVSYSINVECSQTKHNA